MCTSKAAVLGFDYGKRRTGVAVADWQGHSITPLAIINPRDQQALRYVLSEWLPDIIVMGLPVTMRGNHCDNVDRTRHFVTVIQGILQVRVAWADERLTTKEQRYDAQVYGDEQPKHVDSLVACALLRQWFGDEKKRSASLL